MKLYAIAIVAVKRSSPDAAAVAVQQVVALLGDDEPIDAYGMARARALFPSGDGWEQHLIHPIEIEAGMMWRFVPVECRGL